MISKYAIIGKFFVNSHFDTRNRAMQFARWVFLIAGVYGILAVAPMYFFEAQIAIDFPPAITHPEYYYGFIGVTLSWQVLFLLLSRDPQRYRIMMLPASVEKGAYGIAIIWLFVQERVANFIVGAAIIDLTFGVLFLIAFWRTGDA